MRLLCILNGDAEHPSTRFRVLQHLPALREAGLDVELFVARKRGFADLRALRRMARTAGAVLIQKKLFAVWKLRWLLGPAPVLFDIDDAIFEISPFERQRFGEARGARRARSRRRRLRAVLGRSRRVIAGNEFLARYAAAEARDVVVLPTGVDLGPFPEDALRRARADRRARGAGVRIGWMGSRPSLAYLAALAAPLRAVCDRHPGARLVQVCNDFIDLPGVPTEKRAWNRDREPQDLMGFDIGLMPVDDTPFARGKCGLNILQYHAAAVPVVCSPVGVNREIVRHGETGLFATGDGEWVEAIDRLLGAPEMAQALGDRGREVVRQRYEASRIGARLADLVRSAVA